MGERTKADIEIISQALDELMICKGRNVMPMESKMIWMKRLVEKETKVVLWAIEQAIRTPGWPEIYVIFDQCREYLNVHAGQIERDGEMKLRALLLQYEENENKNKGVKSET